MTVLLLGAWVLGLQDFKGLVVQPPALIITHMDYITTTSTTHFPPLGTASGAEIKSAPILTTIL